MLDSLYLVLLSQINKLKKLLENKLNKTGGTVTGEVNLTGSKQLLLNGIGSLSTSDDGTVLFGENCYLEKSTGKFKFLTTHSTMGARGTVYKRDNTTNALQPWWFDTGLVATVADAEFSPDLKKIWHQGNLTANEFASTFARKAGDTYTGTHIFNGKIDASNGKFRLPVGIDKWS